MKNIKEIEVNYLYKCDLVDNHKNTKDIINNNNSCPNKIYF